MTTTFESLSPGDTIDGPSFAVSRESIRLFCDGSLDYNPLHLDDDYMKGNFGKTNFGGIIMHGMNNFGLITRMLTDWAYPAGAIHRRLRDPLGQAGQTGRHHPADGNREIETGHGEFTLGADRRHGEEPGRREGRDRRGHGGVSAGCGGMSVRVESRARASEVRGAAVLRPISARVGEPLQG